MLLSIAKITDARSISREFLREFIDMYKELLCLWQIKSKEYLDKNKKTEAYDVLINKLKTVQPDAAKATVINKINSLRGSFRREYKEVVDSKRSGAGVDEIYVPSLWYYELLMFVKDQDIVRESVSNISDDDDNDEVLDDRSINQFEEDNVSSAADNEREVRSN